MLNLINEKSMNINIVQFGCGGIGSWLAQFVGKFLHVIVSRYEHNENFRIQYIIIDGDVVEERNILRQNFLPENIGDYKCNAIFKIIITPQIEPNLKFITDNLYTPLKIYNLLNGYILNYEENIFIILGCLDNIKTRRSIYTAIKKLVKQFSNVSTIYIDGGNDLQHGQCITTVKTNSDWFKNSIKNWKDIYYKFPDIHKIFKIQNESNNVERSCAFFGDQTMSINLKVAAEMFGILQKILIDSIIPIPLIRYVVI